MTQAKQDLAAAYTRAALAIAERRFDDAFWATVELLDFCRAGEIPSDCLSCPPDGPFSLYLETQKFNGYVLRRAS